MLLPGDTTEQGLTSPRGTARDAKGAEEVSYMESKGADELFETDFQLCLRCERVIVSQQNPAAFSGSSPSGIVTRTTVPPLAT